MTGATFFAVLGGCALFGVIAEYAWSVRHGLGWHEAGDTLANVNLAAGQLFAAVLTTAVVLGGYEALWSVRPVDLASALPPAARIVVGFLLAELLQYWNHRISHVLQPFRWGHDTHHSSSRMNLSTGVRINWVYRMYAWVLYAPMALVGFTTAEFVLFQTAMNVYNLFMHTRFDVPYGPLRWILVTPAAHRLHHTADPRWFGNYGASLVVWDRLFGTFRDPVGAPDLPWGSARNVDTGDPVRINLGLPGAARTGAPGWGVVLAVGSVLLAGLWISQAHEALGVPVRVGLVIAGLMAAWVVGTRIPVMAPPERA